MGQYTELSLRCKIDTSNKAFMDVLNAMINCDDIPKNEVSDHPLFAKHRLGFIFHGCSSYFDNDPFAEIKGNVLTTVFNLKNYEREIETFLDWLSPFITEWGIIGEYTYECWKPLTVEKQKDGTITLGDEKIRIGGREL